MEGGGGGSMEAGLLAALEQLESVEAALLAHPADPDLLRAKLELTELLTLSSLLHAPSSVADDSNNLDSSSSTSSSSREKVADMFGGDDEEWERTHEREFALHTERQQRPPLGDLSSSSSAKRKRGSDGEDEDEGLPDHGLYITPSTNNRNNEEPEGEEDGWLACRVVTTETHHGGRPRRVWRDALLHSRKADDGGRYRVTLLHSRLTQEVRPEDVLLQGATLKHLNHAAPEEGDNLRRKQRKRSRRTSDGDSDYDDSSDDGFEGFSLMRATGGHDYVVGEWESHTSGIGSKLLAKMGYAPGRGLGRQGEGIVKPLGIGFKAPSRKKELLGLGHDERNNKKKEGEGGGGAEEEERRQAFDEAGNPIPRKRRRGRKKRKKAMDDEQEDDAKRKKKSDVFGFLNDIGQVNSSDKTKTMKDGSKEGKGSSDDVYKKMTTKELQDSFKKKIVEKDEVSAKIKQLEDSVQRNKDRDPAMAAQAKQRMREARTKLHALHSEIKELTTRLKIKEGVKKAIVF